MKKPKYIPPFGDIPSQRQKMPELPVEERRENFNEVELGFTEEMALAEAARCLSCRRCIGCGLCLAECDQEAVVYDETAEDVSLEADSIIFTSDGEAYDPAGKPELGYTRSANVITSLEFERLASPTGPFGGHILRPFDGERPRRIAFVQCVGSRDEGIGANFCSVVCCSRTFTQARQARDQLAEVRVTIFHRGLRPVGKRSELDLADLEAAGWADFVECAVGEIKEDPETGAVTVTYTKGDETGRAEFDLVVLAVGVRSKPQFRRHARAAGLKTDKYGFVGRGLAELVAGSRGVAFAGAIEGPVSDGAGIVGAIAAAGSGLEFCAGSDGDPAGGGNGEIAVFACQYGLGLAGLDGDAAGELKSDGIELAGSYPFLCYKEGRRAMADKAGRGGRVVVLGCHRGSHEVMFERVLGLAHGGVAIVGIDEMGEGFIDKVKSLTTDFPATSKPSTSGLGRVAVVGGGTSGLAAAGELLRRGLEVALIEKSPAIGASFLEAFRDAGGEAEASEGFVKSIEANPKATILPSSTVSSLERSDGKLVLTVTTPSGTESLEVGAVLVATGAGRYEPHAYLYGENESVIDQWDFTGRIGGGKTDAKQVVMIQCVGARDAEHPYCSRYCCKQAISNALLYKSNNPEAEITILHKGIRVFGLEEDLYTDALEKGVRFVKATSRPEVLEGTPLRVRAESEADGEIELDADLVVLSLAHSHGPDQEALSKTLGAPLDDLGFFSSGESILEPFRMPAEGVFVCGFARQPVIAGEAYIEGLGAAEAICKTLTG